MTEEREGGALEHALHKMEDVVGGWAGKGSAAMTDRAEDFIESAAMSDMYEIEAGRLALDRARSPDVREVAQKMIDDHTESSAKLEASLTPELRSAVPAGLNSRRESMLQHLREAEDAMFDKTYLDQQRMAHEEAVTLMHHFRDNGDNASLRNFAADVSPVIEGHLERIKQLAVAQ